MSPAVRVRRIGFGTRERRCCERGGKKRKEYRFCARGEPRQPLRSHLPRLSAPCLDLRETATGLAMVWPSMTGLALQTDVVDAILMADALGRMTLQRRQMVKELGRRTSGMRASRAASATHSPTFASWGSEWMGLYNVDWMLKLNEHENAKKHVHRYINGSRPVIRVSDFSLNRVEHVPRPKHITHFH